MCQRIQRTGVAGLPESVSIARPAARREFAPIGFEKAKANHVPYTNPEIAS
jgi:hypothetical protein